MMISEEEKKYYKTSANNYKDLDKFSVASNLINRWTALNGLGVNCLTYNRYPLISWTRKMQGFGNLGKVYLLQLSKIIMRPLVPNLKCIIQPFENLKILCITLLGKLLPELISNCNLNVLQLIEKYTG